MKTIAFYLPQFHPIPENNMWWGKGFTEWTNVTRATPLFRGHYQPRLPADLGFYDLRLAEIRSEQAKLAKEYGLYGFCYHYYWFNGKKLLDLPLNKVLESKEPDFPFCICYANENWTRRWDGQDNEILIKQEYNSDSYREFIRDLIPIFKDHRYIRLKNKPLLLIYRAKLFPNASEATKIWRQEARKEGFEDLFICKCQSFGDFGDPRETGFDASVEFPPHGLNIPAIDKYINMIKSSIPHFSGKVFEYSDAAIQMMLREWPDYKVFKTIMLGWDNSPRIGAMGHLFHNFSIDLYERWLLKVFKRTIERYPEEERFVFINSWNEWAEGTYLEPDARFGHEYLRATKRAIASAEGWEDLISSLNEIIKLTKGQERNERILNGVLNYLENKETTEVLLIELLNKLEDELFQLRNQSSLMKEKDEIINAMRATKGWRALEKFRYVRNRIFKKELIR